MTHKGHLLVLLMLMSTLCATDEQQFEFTQKPLMRLLEMVRPAHLQLIYPQKGDQRAQLAEQKASYLPHTPVPQEARWGLVKMFLEQSGFSAYEQNNNLIVVRSGPQESNRAPLPVYAGTLPATMPEDDTRIRYIHYLKNLKVPKQGTEDTHPLTKMITQFSSPTSSLVLDPATNSIILTDTARHIYALARLLNAFDARGFQEEVAYIPLLYVPAQDIVSIINSMQAASGKTDANGYIRKADPGDTLTQSTESISIVADTIRNGVILLGKGSHIERVSRFITEYLDTPQDSGGSILHYYDLQYLDNQTMAPLLMRLVSPVQEEGSQAQQAQEKPFFQGVAIAAEEAVVRKPALATEDIIITQKGFEEIQPLDEVPTNAGNRLIIAARTRDWEVLKKLIYKLDVPQPQVLLEVLIAEFSYDHQTLVAGTLRSKTDTPMLPDGVQYLASHVTPVSSVLGANPTQLAEDLLQVVGPGNVASQMTPGSLLLSLNDTKTPGIFGLLQTLDTVLSAHITSHPFITIKNNTPGTLDATETRQTTGDLVIEFDGSFSIPIIDLAASINVTAVPHIISDSQVRLNIGFTIEEFLGDNTFNRLTRELRTTATIRSGEILAMGGIMRTDNTDDTTYTPILGNIPLFGAFFRRTQATTRKRNVTLFAMPTIISARSQQMQRTQRFLDEHNEYALPAGPMEDMRDPIVRLFFKDDSQRGAVNSFMHEQAVPEGDKIPRIMQVAQKRQRRFDPERLRRLLTQKTQHAPPFRELQTTPAGEG